MFVVFNMALLCMTGALANGVGTQVTSMTENKLLKKCQRLMDTWNLVFYLFMFF